MHPRWAESGWSLVGIYTTEAQAREVAAIQDDFGGSVPPCHCRMLRPIEADSPFDIHSDSEGWIDPL